LKREHRGRSAASCSPPDGCRKALFRGVWCAAFAWLLLAGVAPAPASAQPPPLRWGADAEGGAPFIFLDPQDPTRQIGFEVDLAKALADELGRPIEFVQYPYDELIPGLSRGDIDLAMNGLEIMPDRAGKIRFSRPYYVYKLQLVVRADETRFDSLEACKAGGAVVGTLGETAASRMLEQLGIQARIFDGQVEPYRDLELKRLDAVLMDLPIAVYYALPNPKLKFAGDPLGEGFYAIAFRPGDEELARQFDLAIVALAERGELRRIYEKWRIWNDDQARLASGEALENILAESGRGFHFSSYFPLLLEAAGVTIQLSVLSMFVAVALGMPIALARLYGPPPLRWLATGYVEFFRGIPVLLLLYLIYFGLPALVGHQHAWFAQGLTGFVAGVIAFGLTYAAYEAEIYRASISAVPAGQWEAAASLGMSPWDTFRRIILPQAFRIMLPPMTNDFVALFKDTSLVSVIAVVELTKRYMMLSKSSLKYMEIGLVTALLYLAMSVPLGYLSSYLERRWGKGQN
jgi:polar amino acid transport system substrate-binding protein